MGQQIDTSTEAHWRSLADPDRFWRAAAEGIDWIRAPSSALGNNDPAAPAWFADGLLNTCYNAVDRHVEGGRANQDALIYVSAMTGETRCYSYQQLRDEVARTAGMLRRFGVEKGDRVLIYMPMVPECAIAMLACARLGAVHSVVFGGFAAPELAKRIDDATPSLLLTASCGLEPGRIVAYQPLLEDALASADHAVRRCVVLQREAAPSDLKEDRDVDWQTALADSDPADCVPVAGGDPLYVLYTSGTTGVPKGIVRDNGGHAVALNWSMENVYGIHPGEVFWAASDIGWVVGHSYIVYGPLLAGCTTVLYEGKPVGTPDAGVFWRVIDTHNVKVFFTAPTALRAIKRDDPDGEAVPPAGLASLAAVFLAGERADPDTFTWATRTLGVPVLDHWWQTELGWPALAHPLAPPERIGSAGRPVPGFDVAVLDTDTSTTSPKGSVGDLVLRLPLPPGCASNLWQNETGWQDNYLSAHTGYYQTGDAGYIDDAGFVFVMGRTDDLINVAGHRLSTGAMEQVLADHPAVAECAVVGTEHPIKGMVPLGFVVCKRGRSGDDPSLAATLNTAIRKTIGPIAALEKVLIVPALPKTRSGKVLRASLREIANGKAPDVPATIEDAQVLDDIRSHVAAHRP